MGFWFGVGQGLRLGLGLGLGLRLTLVFIIGAILLSQEQNVHSFRGALGGGGVWTSVRPYTHIKSINTLVRLAQKSHTPMYMDMMSFLLMSSYRYILLGDGLRVRLQPPLRHHGALLRHRPPHQVQGHLLAEVLDRDHDIVLAGRHGIQLLLLLRVRLRRRRVPVRAVPDRSSEEGIVVYLYNQGVLAVVTARYSEGSLIRKRH